MLTDLNQGLRNDLSAEHGSRSPSGGQLTGGEDFLQTLDGSQSAAHKIQTAYWTVRVAVLVWVILPALAVSVIL